MTKTVWLDMDGTFADLYAVEGWLPMLRAYDPAPYRMAKPLVHMSTLARLLNKAQRNGWHIGVISWTSKVSTPEYDAEVEVAKREWLAKHLPSVCFDDVHIVPYGTPKQSFCGSPVDVLFDDEARHLDAWTGFAVNAKELLTCLRGKPATCNSLPF